MVQSLIIKTKRMASNIKTSSGTPPLWGKEDDGGGDGGVNLILR